MSQSAEAAEQIVNAATNMTVKGVECVSNLAGKGALKLATFLIAVIKEEKKAHEGLCHQSKGYENLCRGSKEVRYPVRRCHQQEAEGRSCGRRCQRSRRRQGQQDR